MVKPQKNYTCRTLKSVRFISFYRLTISTKKRVENIPPDNIVELHLYNNSPCTKTHALGFLGCSESNITLYSLTERAYGVKHLQTFLHINPETKRKTIYKQHYQRTKDTDNFTKTSYSNPHFKLRSTH